MPQTPANKALSTLQGAVETGGEGGDKTFSTTTPYRVGGGGGGGAPQGGGGEPPSGLAPVDQSGSWASGIDYAERRARLRSLRQTACLLIGPRSANLCRWLAQAETDPAALEPPCRALDVLSATDRRQILASYAALARSAA
jgi:hypothetical protein